MNTLDGKNIGNINTTVYDDCTADILKASFFLWASNLGILEKKLLLLLVINLSNVLLYDSH